MAGSDDAAEQSEDFNSEDDAEDYERKPRAAEQVCEVLVCLGHASRLTPICNDYVDGRVLYTIIPLCACRLPTRHLQVNHALLYFCIF